MQIKTYTLVCHICGKVFTKVANFISVPISIQVDGRALPAMSCGDHTQQDIKCAWRALSSLNVEKWNEYREEYWI